MKKYKRIVDNKMRDFGDTDIEKKIIRINKSKRKNKKHGDIIDTIVHEENHAAHPKKHEKTVRIETKNALKHMSQTKKKKLYSLYR